MELNKLISLLTVMAFLVAFIIGGYFKFGYIVIAIVGGSALLAFFAWLKTTFNKPAEPAIILPIFLVGIACLMVHIIEEYLTGFAPRMSQTFHICFTTHEFVLFFGMAGYVVWILSALGLMYKNRVANFFAWVFLIGPGTAEIAHYIFPLYEGGPYHYFPGMYTAWMPMIPGIYGIYILLKEAKK